MVQMSVSDEDVGDLLLRAQAKCGGCTAGIDKKRVINGGTTTSYGLEPALPNNLGHEISFSYLALKSNAEWPFSLTETQKRLTGYALS